MCARDRIIESSEAFCPEKAKPTINPKMAKLIQYYTLKHKHSLLKKDHERVPYSEDWLSVCVNYAKIGFEKLCICCKKLDDATGNRRFRMSQKSTRRRDMVLGYGGLVILIASMIFKMYSEPVLESRSLFKFTYLFCLAILIGTQTWMAGVSGLALFYSLPRHVFGAVQEILFPLFYFHNIIVNFVMVFSMIQVQKTIIPWSEDAWQIGQMIFIYVVYMIINIHISPMIVSLKHKKTKVEESAGQGGEIGHHDIGNLRFCPEYMKVFKKFKLMHSLTMMATVTCILMSINHLFYLSGKLCL